MTKFSVEEINVWFVLSSIIALSHAVLFGFNSTFTRFISYVYGGVKIGEFSNLKTKNKLNRSDCIDKIEFSNVYSLMRLVYIAISFIYLSVLILLCFIFLEKPIGYLQDKINGWSSVIVILISTTFTLLMGHYQVLLTGLNKVFIVQRVIGLVNLFGIILVVYVISEYPSLLSLVLVYQTIQITSILIIIYYARKELKHLGINFKYQSFNSELFKIVWASAWKSGLTSIVTVLFKYSSSLFVSSNFSPSVSASFLFTKKIFDILEKFTSKTFHARLPNIAIYRGQGNLEALIPYLKNTFVICYISFIVLYSLFLFIGEYFIDIINSSVKLGSMHLIILFSFSVLLNRWSGMLLSVSNQANYIIEHLTGFLVLIIFFIFIYFTYNILGLYSVPIGQIIAILLISPFIIIKTYKSFFTKFFVFEKRVFLPSFALLTLVNIIYFNS